MPSPELRELDAYYALLNTWPLAKPVSSADDLSDGVALWTVLSSVDSEYFRPPSETTSDNWVLRFTALKRLYRLMTQYLSDALGQPVGAFDVPALQEMAKNANLDATLLMCRLAVTIAVRCENNAEVIQKIQDLPTEDQGALMEAMQKVMSQGAPDSGEITMTEDDHYYQIQSDRSRVVQEKETVNKAYQVLLEEHRRLQASVEDLKSEKDEAISQAQQAAADADRLRDDKAEPAFKAEIDRLRLELQKSEDNLAAAETELQRQTDTVADLTRASDELQIKADGYDKIKDQLDEYKHLAEKAQRQENVMEKYKKKLQEGADLRQQLKSLEKQNADLVDKNASLEEDYRKVATFKPLMETYKGQIVDLETRISQRTTEVESARFELEQTRAKLRTTEVEKARDAETLELYQERVRELELAGPRKSAPSASPAARATSPTSTDALGSITGTETAAEDGEDDEEDDVSRAHGLGGELDDALSGTTTTDLKLQIGKLKRELEAAKSQQAEASRVLVLENLLDDARRAKARYEQDYLMAHREKLKLQSDLEEIRSGKALGDGAEAAIALRQRLNETVEELDGLKKTYAELEVKSESQFKELTIAKSDLNLVNKDQLEILATLRDSVNEDKAGLEAETARLEKQMKDLSDKNRLQLEQINGLLLEKVNLQTEGIGQREKMLQRERDIGDLRAAMSGRDLPEDIKSRLLGQHEENVQFQEQIKTLNDKLLKARQFIKQQDKLAREEYGKAGLGGVTGASEENDTSHKLEITALKDTIERLKREQINIHRKYRREQEIMLSAFHNRSMQDLRSHLGGQQPQMRPEAKSWLGQQRRMSGQQLRIG